MKTSQKAFLLNPILILSAMITGFVTMYNWSSRHPYLVFFQSKFLMLLRFGLAMGIFFLIFSLIRALVRFLVQSADTESQRQFFQFDLLTYLMLGPVLFGRYFIPGRREGNLYYLAIFAGWFFIKLALMALYFDRKVWAKFPSHLFSLLKKSKKIGQVLFEKKEYKLSYFLIIFAYALLLQVLFTTSLPRLSLAVPITYCCFFFCSLLFLHAVAHTFLPKKVYSFLIYASFLICILSTLDYFSFQMVNLHMKGSLSALFADGIKEIPKVLEGADVKPVYFILSVVLTVSLPLAGVWLHSRLPSKKVSFSLLTPLILVSLSLGLCYQSDHYIQRKLSIFNAQAIKRTFPIYPFFIKTQGEQISFDHALTPPPSPEQFKEALNAPQSKLVSSPHIFVLVIESLRDDYLNEETAPFLTQLRKQSPQFSLTASNANVTHPSLFTIYTGLLPHHWITVRDHHQNLGSFPLHLLKKSGYQLTALHSSFFKYFNIGEAIFGKDYELLDTLYEARELSGDVAERDAMIVKEAKSLLKSKLESPLYMTLLFDSTHHHYYWPETFEVPFKPYLKAFNYMNKGKEQLELTKNRYRNSIFYVDSLVKEFCDYLKSEGLYDSSLIVITGDHGEEFMENGHYFHGTDLCLPQSHVPIIYKFPKDYEQKSHQMLSSHVDIFPTLFDCLGLTYSEQLLDGQSIFSSEKNSIISFRPQYKKNPYQFYIHTGDEKLEAKFMNSEEIYKSKGVEVTAIRDRKESLRSLEEITSIQDYTMQVFGRSLHKLFLSSKFSEAKNLDIALETN